MKEKEPLIYYGWYILTIGMLGAFMATGTSQLFMSIMLKPWEAEFGWSRTAIAGATTTGTILSGLLSLPCGKLVDRYGTRWLTALGALVIAGLYFFMARFVTLWQFYIVLVVVRVVSINSITGIVPRTAAVNWFQRFRGRALGLLSMSTPLGVAALAFVSQVIMERHGWRTVFILFAIATIFLQALPAALILRRRPEDCGLVPDGDQDEYFHGSAQIPGKEEFSWTLREATRTRAMWYIIVASILALMVNAGVGFHLVAYYTDAGIATQVAVGALSASALIGALANLIWGFLSERASERTLAVVVMILTAGAILYLLSVHTPAGAYFFAILFGLTSRGEGTLVNIILAQYFGRGSFGAISGFISPFNMLGLGFGPLISSVTFDLTGSYQWVFTVFIALSTISAILLWLARKPVPPERKTS